jgi:electron transfer flavoprotein alpha subunit
MDLQSDILVFIEFDDKGVLKSSLSAISAAKIISDDICGLIFNPNDNVKTEISNYLRNTIAIEGSQFSKYQAEHYAPAIAELLKTTDASKLFGGLSSTSKDLFGRVAALCNSAVISDVIKLFPDGNCVRPVHAGNGLIKVGSKTSTTLYTIRQTAFSPSKTNDKTGVITRYTVSNLAIANSEVINVSIKTTDKPTLNEANVVIGCGRGIGSLDFINGPVEDLSKLLTAAVGGTRASCDLGYMSSDLQIGQTGKVIAPDLYIALGISGAIQHIAGIRDSKTIIAINSNELAPIFESADVGLIARVENILPELIDELKKN